MKQRVLPVSALFALSQNQNLRLLADLAYSHITLHRSISWVPSCSFIVCDVLLQNREQLTFWVK